MNDWQQAFVGKLEVARKHWRQHFENFADEQLKAVFEEFATFTVAQGMLATAPTCELGTRFFKFALTENAYVLLTFRMAGMDRVQFQAEYILPGSAEVAPATEERPAADADETWVRACFERSLEEVVVAFGEASAELAGELAAA